MMYLSVIVIVDGREAMPLRAIPFVTGRQVTPDMLVRALSADAGWDSLRDLAAYRLTQGTSRNILPRDWDALHEDYKALCGRLEHEETTPNQLYPEWRDETLRMLPSGCFVWCDEFAAAFARYRSHFLDLESPRDGDDEADYTPYLGELAEFVMEGFGAIASEIEQEAVPTGREKAAWMAERKQLLKLVYGMARDKYGFDPGRERNAATGANSGSIQAGLDRLGIKIDTCTVHKHLSAAADMWAASDNDNKSSP